MSATATVEYTCDRCGRKETVEEDLQMRYDCTNIRAWMPFGWVLTRKRFRDGPELVHLCEECNAILHGRAARK